jgi:hypothetical protein
MRGAPTTLSKKSSDGYSSVSFEKRSRRIVQGNKNHGQIRDHCRKEDRRLCFDITPIMPFRK